MRRIAILGSTGSIGVNALDVVRRLNNGRGPKGSHRVLALAAQRNVALLKKQVREFRPGAVSLDDPEAARHIRRWAKRSAPGLKVWEGAAGLERLASGKETDY